MTDKPQDALFWKSKTFWMGVLATLAGIYLLLGDSYTQYKSVAPLLIAQGLGMIGIRDAVALGELFKANK